MPDQESLAARPQPERRQESEHIFDAADRRYVVVLRRDLQITEVTRLLHYVTDFGTGDARGHERDGGWCLRLTELADVRLLTSQCADLIEDVGVEEET